jgi:hypothetical protein
MTARYAPDRPWAEKWHETEAAYQVIVDMYARELPVEDNREWRDLARDFFRSCHEMVDALGADGNLPTAIRNAVTNAARDDVVLTLVADVDNTLKHSGRDPGKTRATMEEMHWPTETGGVAITIIRTAKDGRITRHDALQAATDAMDAWKKIIQDNQLA